MVTHKSNIKLGEKYQDSFTGVKGTATAVTFYVHACERVTLEFIKDGEVKYEAFDAPRLIHYETGAPVTLVEKKTGGPGGREARQNRTEVQ